MNGENNQAWAILLAGGEWTRLSALTRRITGETIPKQFCQLIGNESLLEQTRRQVSLAIKQDDIITVLTRSHERFYKPIMGDAPLRNMIVQPQNRGKRQLSSTPSSGSPSWSRPLGSFCFLAIILLTTISNSCGTSNSG